MKKLKYSPYAIIPIIILIFILNCSDSLESYKKPETHEAKISSANDSKTYEIYNKNFLNIKNNYPFFIIRQNAFLFLTKPADEASMPDQYLPLTFGDVLFPVSENNPTKYFFYVRTADNRYGWIHSDFGVSINFDDDQNLFYFNYDYYIKEYLYSKGENNNSSKLVLLSNIIPMLLGNYSTAGWFYPVDVDFALKLSNYAVDISTDNQDIFYNAFSVQYWKSSEKVIAYNLLADCYQKMKLYDKAEDLHNFLIKRYFWQKSDNSEFGGLTSIIKLHLMYIEEIKKEKKGSDKYKFLKNKIIDNIINVVNDKGYNTMTSKDFKWRGLTFAEWVLNILMKNIDKEEFYDICGAIISKTDSDGFIDFTNFYIALEKINEGKEQEAMEFLKNYKPKQDSSQVLRFNDWLSAKKILPDSIIYQYNFK